MSAVVKLLADAFAWLLLPKATLLGMTIGGASVWWCICRPLHRESLRLSEENRKLREWQARQGEPSGEGAYRRMSATKIHGIPRWEDHREDLMPDATTVPSGGRIIES